MRRFDVMSDIKLTLEEAIKRVAKIEASKGDDEMAHSMEDELAFDFINELAMGSYAIDEAIEIAKVVQSTSQIEFSRWCA